MPDNKIIAPIPIITEFFNTSTLSSKLEIDSVDDESLESGIFSNTVSIQDIIPNATITIPITFKKLLIDIFKKTSVNKIFQINLTKYKIVNIMIRFIYCQHQLNSFFRIKQNLDRYSSFVEIIQ